jgi:hypothetical protein
VIIDGDVNENIVRATHGFYCDSLSADNKFLQCVVKYVGTSGFYLIGTSNTIVECHIFGGPTNCVRASANTLISGCFIDTPDDVGVEVNAVGVMIVGNRFFANTTGPYYNVNAVGIRLVGGARNITVVGNFFRFLDKEIDFGSAFQNPGLSWGNSSSDITTGTDVALNFLTDDLTMKGDNDAAALQMIIRVQASQEARFLFQTLGNRRWQIYKDGSSESGADAGSNLSFNRYTDAGGFLGTVLSLRRDTGEFRVLEGMRHFGDLGFFGKSAVPKPTVTGATGGNAALQSLLTALVDLGLITDNTT